MAGAPDGVSVSAADHGVPASTLARLILASIGVLAVLAVFRGTFASMVAVWASSVTFAYGYTVFPIAVWLFWRKRRLFLKTRLRTSYAAILVLAFLGFGWAIGSAADVKIVMQYAVVGMLISLVWLIMGAAVVRVYTFPLFFLLFAVPVGEGLVYPMMEFTAAFAVRALQLSGIAVYWEGMYITLPTGQWSVVEACSGLRYFLASAILGSLYAYLTYRSTRRRALFVLASVVLPIFVNGVRAYLTILTGHLSMMQYGTGADHLIFGWVLFGAYLLALFWVGSFWREDEALDRDVVAQNSVQTTKTSTLKPAVALCMGLAVVIIWPAWVHHLQSSVHAVSATVLNIPPEISGWRQTTTPLSEWTPHYRGAAVEVEQTYEKGVNQMGVYVAYYGEQERGTEMVTAKNALITRSDRRWRWPYKRVTQTDMGFAVTESEIFSPGQRLLVWDWYWVSGQNVRNRYRVKLVEALSWLKNGHRNGAAVILFTSIDDDPNDARAELAMFAADMLPALNEAFARAGGG